MSFPFKWGQGTFGPRVQEPWNPAREPVPADDGAAREPQVLMLVMDLLRSPSLGLGPEHALRVAMACTSILSLVIGYEPSELASLIATSSERTLEGMNRTLAHRGLTVRDLIVRHAGEPWEVLEEVTGPITRS